MEVLLLWLDEVDDLVFAALLVWERSRRLCLAIGLLAALALHAGYWWNVPAAPVFTLSNVALASVLVWCVLSLTALLVDGRIETSSETA